MKIVIIDYNAGNTKSVKFALQRLGYESVLSADADVIQAADKVIFPGVGEASWAMKELKNKGLDKLIPQLKQPFLGICLGMQLLCKSTQEGDVDTLSIFPVQVKKFEIDLKIPQIGWNNVAFQEQALFKDIQNQAYFYFVHSYYVPLFENTIATSNYEINFSAAIHKDNFWASQFHPEKSGQIGEIVLKNFLEL